VQVKSKIIHFELPSKPRGVKDRAQLGGGGLEISLVSIGVEAGGIIQAHIALGVAALCKVQRKKEEGEEKGRFFS